PARDPGPGRVAPPLPAPPLHERLLHRMERAVLREPFDGDDLGAVSLGREHEAGADERPVQQDRARAALALLARILRAGQADALPEREQETLALPHVRLAAYAVHGHRHLHAARHLSIARDASTRSACRRYAALPRTSSIGLAAAATRSVKPSSAPTTSVGTGAAEPNAARASPRSPSTVRASEQTAITIALRGPIFMKVCGAPLGRRCTATMSSSSARAFRFTPVRDSCIGTRRRPRTLATSTSAPSMSSGGKASPAGEAVPRLPPTVPRLRICGEPTVRAASASAGRIDASSECSTSA